MCLDDRYEDHYSIYDYQYDFYNYNYYFDDYPLELYQEDETENIKEEPD